MSNQKILNGRYKGKDFYSCHQCRFIEFAGKKSLVVFFIILNHCLILPMFLTHHTEDLEGYSKVIVAAHGPLAHALKEIADSYFRIAKKSTGSLYQKAAREIRQCPTEIRDKKDAALKGIGKAICAQVDEFLRNGRCPLADELKEIEANHTPPVSRRSVSLSEVA